MKWNQAKERVAMNEVMSYENIMKKKDIYAGLAYLRLRASTIRQTQIVDMIQTELKVRSGKSEK